MIAKQDSYLIIGAGVFGASTALHLRQSKPDAVITIVDRTPYPNPSGASHDLNKIIRADYHDLFYMKLALEAQDEWRHNKIFTSSYHESGMCFTEKGGWTRQCFENFKIINVNTGGRILTLEEARKEFPVFENADWEGSDGIYHNPTSGWGEADKAMKSILDAAVQQGVSYVQATVSSLRFSQNGSCVGATLDTGEEINVTYTLMCTGPYTAKLLADSAPENKKLQTDGRIIAAGAIQCFATCDPEYLNKYKNAPVFFNGAPHIEGESIPPLADGRMKFNFEGSFSNMTHHEASGQDISVPPGPVSQSTWSQDVPETLKKQVLNVVWSMYGKDAPGIHPTEFRMCWDSITPNQDWVITPHPHCEALYIAGGGSFHSWKFLPTIGKYVVQMMDGTLEEEKALRWAWDRPQEGGACAMYAPSRDIKDIS